ncbi:uncharacterized protein BT62DRAFT_1005311 [Guyanagaster necrorhizus]|uniref:Uncharacterized protein n=1 Tax=Guyanagaster necrorhizus TaxID=856835 RepID=A0A9P8AT10_9AGAR|nr:uncharacterized protein BT62DRAFT_1005311 [Guyanagaster necrorhizus MCA 3950]KAG7446914.1 hypothetical protein BT62DRAFT_1005311 [Guyanagaster necrorhizus MCA 3950]
MCPRSKSDQGDVQGQRLRWAQYVFNGKDQTAPILLLIQAFFASSSSSVAVFSFLHEELERLKGNYASVDDSRTPLSDIYVLHDTTIVEMLRCADPGIRKDLSPNIQGSASNIVLRVVYVGSRRNKEEPNHLVLDRQPHRPVRDRYKLIAIIFADIPHRFVHYPKTKHTPKHERLEFIKLPRTRVLHALCYFTLLGTIEYALVPQYISPASVVLLTTTKPLLPEVSPAPTPYYDNRDACGALQFDMPPHQTTFTYHKISSLLPKRGDRTRIKGFHPS